jgi:hypothetical protein
MSSPWFAHPELKHPVSSSIAATRALYARDLHDHGARDGAQLEDLPKADGHHDPGRYNPGESGVVFCYILTGMSAPMAKRQTS